MYNGFNMHPIEFAIMLIIRRTYYTEKMLLEEFISEKKLSKIIIAASDLNKKLSKVKRLV